MIEHFHCQLKTALRAYPEQQRWSEYVSITLLGCPAPIKEDLGYSPTELVYRVPLSLSGQMLNPIDLTATDSTLYINRLRSYFNNLVPMNPWQQTTKSSVPKDITSWILKRCCESPSHFTLYQFLSCARTHRQTFTLAVGGKKETVSIDRVKSTFTDTATQEPHIPLTYTFH